MLALLFFLKGGVAVAENYIDAEKDYMLGMKYKDIATKYGVSINTVKSWKQRYSWKKDKKSVHTKSEIVCTQNKKDATASVRQIDDGTKETLQNDNLTPEQQMFCIYYSRTFNATQSYLNVYHCSYETAMVNGCLLLRNTNVRAELERLKEIKRQQIVAGADDIVELQMRIAFADMGSYLSFGKTTVDLKSSSGVDTQLIRKVSEGRNGITVEVEDRQKAIDWLTKYFLIHPDDKYKAEFDRKRAEIGDNTGEEILRNMQTITDILQNPVPNRNISDFEGGDNNE